MDLQTAAVAAIEQQRRDREAQAPAPLMLSELREAARAANDRANNFMHRMQLIETAKAAELTKLREAHARELGELDKHARARVEGAEAGLASALSECRGAKAEVDRLRTELAAANEREATSTRRCAWLEAEVAKAKAKAS